MLPQEPGGLEDEILEVEHSALGELAAVEGESASVIRDQRIRHQTMEAEQPEQRPAPSGLYPAPAENFLLIFLVGDPEPALDPEDGPELAEQSDGKRVNRGAAHGFGPVA